MVRQRVQAPAGGRTERHEVDGGGLAQPSRGLVHAPHLGSRARRHKGMVARVPRALPRAVARDRTCHFSERSGALALGNPLTQPRPEPPYPRGSLQEGLDTATATAPRSGTGGFSNPSFSDSDPGAEIGGDHDQARPAPTLRLVPEDRIDPQVRALAKSIEESGFNFAACIKPNGGAA